MPGTNQADMWFYFRRKNDKRNRGDGTQVIKLIITDAGMQSDFPIADGKGSERVNDDIKNLIANIWATLRKKLLLRSWGSHASTSKGQLNKSMSYEKRNKLINKINSYSRVA